MTPSEIHQLVLESGSDHLKVFGGKRYGGVNLQQVPDEITPCLYYLYVSGLVKTYLEVGAASGGLTYIVNKVLQPKAIVLVDNNLHGKSVYRKHILESVKRVEIIGNSQSSGTVKQVQLLHTMFDLVVVDADHRYHGVKQDIENYKSYCSHFLLLHDTIACKGVKKAKEEFENDSEFSLAREFISTEHRQPLGIALFRRNGRWNSQGKK